MFGIGTHLVTCQKQPALGCVFKLVEVNSRPCIKLSEEFEKITFPGKKNAYRIFDKDNNALVDFLTKADEVAPKVGETFLCRHPFMESKRAYLTPSRVDELLLPYWQDGKLVHENLESIEQIKTRVTEQLKCLRSDHKRVLNPTPYKVNINIIILLTSKRGCGVVILIFNVTKKHKLKKCYFLDCRVTKSV